MERAKPLRYLSLALRVFGAIFIVGLPLMMMIWPAVWSWEARQPEYEQMMMGIYATLGVFLTMAAKEPMAHKSFIWFTVWMRRRESWRVPSCCCWHVRNSDRDARNTNRLAGVSRKILQARAYGAVNAGSRKGRVPSRLPRSVSLVALTSPW